MGQHLRLLNFELKSKKYVNVIIWYMAVITRHQLSICFNEQGLHLAFSMQLISSAYKIFVGIHKHIYFGTSSFKFSRSLDHS